MPVTLMYKTPDMSRGKDASAGVGFSSSRDVDDFLKTAPEEMPDNTLFYYREGPMGMASRAWIVRDGQLIQIWSSRIYRKSSITMAQAMAAAPQLSTTEIKELFA